MTSKNFTSSRLPEASSAISSLSLRRKLEAVGGSGSDIDDEEQPGAFPIGGDTERSLLPDDAASHLGGSRRSESLPIAAELVVDRDDEENSNNVHHSQSFTAASSAVPVAAEVLLHPGNDNDNDNGQSSNATKQHGETHGRKPLLFCIVLVIIIGISVALRLSLGGIKGHGNESPTATSEETQGNASTDDDGSDNHTDPTEGPPEETLNPLLVGDCAEVTTCHTDVAAVRQAIAAAATTRDGELVVAICKDIAFDDGPILIEQSGVTLLGCCAPPDQKCNIQGSGNDRNLVVLGDSFTMQNLAVYDGNGATRWEGTSADACGGNLLLEGSGTHDIVNCEFHNGRCGSSVVTNGGNVFVRAPGGRVDMTSSKFVNGTAGVGGGAAIVDTDRISIQECEFSNNEGSGLAVSNPTDRMLIKDSQFMENRGPLAGAILASDFGNTPKLEVIDSRFESNTADSGGGTSSFSGNADLLWKDNLAVGDSSSTSCNGVLYNMNTCIDANSRFPT